jgi:eukaryotic-like serine/threonine-protein kinase
LTQLQWIAAGGSQIGVPAPFSARRQKRERLVWIALAAAALLALAMAPATYYFLKGTPDPEEVRFIVTNMGAAGTGGPPASISPDGRWIIRSPGGTNNGVNAVQLSSVVPQFLLRDNNVSQPFWSPDSQSIGFFEDGKLKTAAAAGGPAKTICEAPPPITLGTWSKDGVILYSSAGVIYRVLAAGGQPTKITEVDKSVETEHLAPFFLPDGHHYLYLAVGVKPEDSAIYVGDIETKGKRTKLLTSEAKAVYAEPGYILFNREGTIYAQAFNAGKLALEGEPVRIADGVPFINSGALVSASLGRTASFAVSQTGVFTYRIGNNSGNQPAASSVPDRTLTWIERSGARTGQVGGPGAYVGVDLSRDGKKVAVHVHDGVGGDSWFFDSDQGRMQRLTFDANQDNSMPVWSPDGARFAFASRRGNKWGLYVKLADGTAKEELIFESDAAKAPMSWTPDGKQLVYWENSSQMGNGIFYVPVTGEKKPVAFLQTQASEQFPQLSPDGKWMAYMSNETGRAEVYIKPFPEGPGKWQISTDGGNQPRWREDGKELFFQLLPNINAVDIKVSGASIVAGVPHTLFAITNPNSNHPTNYMSYAVSRDGKRFLIPQTGVGAATTGGGGLAQTLVAAADQGGSAAAAATNNVMVVVNWPNLLKRK